MEQEEAYRRTWRAFRTVERVADGRHDTEEWRSHEGVYAACVVRVPAESLRPRLDAFQRDLAAFPFARVHPNHFLHITLQELGFVCDRPERLDEITPARFDEFVTAAASAIGEHPPFAAALGPANSFEDAAFLEVHDDGRCARLHGRLRDLAAIPTLPKFPYLPHVTVAHYAADAPVDGLPAVIADWRDRTFGRFAVTQVEIVQFRVDEPYPPLEPYAIIPLDG